jgi:CRP-like cAMP-binding protein
MNEEILAKTAIRKAFPGIFDTEVETMVNLGSIKEYPEQVCLCTEGKVEETFYILLEGEVEITKKINQEEDRILKHLYTGDFFGEMGLIHEAPRAANVITVKPVKVLEIDKSNFNETLQKMSIVSLAMVREVSKRLRENDDLAIEDLRMKAGELADAYQKLAELDMARREFLTTIAHELRTPLTSANGFLQMVQINHRDSPFPFSQQTVGFGDVSSRINFCGNRLLHFFFIRLFCLFFSLFGVLHLCFNKIGSLDPGSDSNAVC